MLNESAICTWACDEDGIWWSCPSPYGDQNAFGFECDGPTENNFKFCPYCGKPLVVGEEVPHD